MSEFFRALEQAERDRAIRQKSQEAGRDTATVTPPRATAAVATPDAPPAAPPAPAMAPPAASPLDLIPAAVAPPTGPSRTVTPPAATASPFMRPPVRVARTEPATPPPGPVR